ncbi:uncharacterized protein [Amphiura filiformis]|uniref:uncharacterized protein n=1 Tax=Amphiura filiformis TaxID=82378 RepID=UPI003B213867
MAKIHIGLPEEVVVIDITQAPNNGNLPEEDDNDDVNLRREFRYIFKVMAILGLYHTPKSWRKSEMAGNLNDTLHRLHRFYCLFIQIILYLNGIRTLVGFWFVENRLIAMQIVAGTYWFLGAVTSSIWYHICNTDKLPEIFSMWQTNCQSSKMSQCFGTSINIGFIRRKRTIIFGGAIAYIVLNTLSCAFAILGPIQSLRNDTYFMVAPTTEPVLAYELVAVSSFIFINGAFTLPPTVLLILCSIISQQFVLFTERFQLTITDFGKFKGCLIALRRQHQYLSKATFILDDAFSFYLAVIFGAVIIINSFVMYQLVVAKSFDNTFSLLLIVFWFLIMSIKFWLIGVIIARLHEHAHDIGNFIHDIGVFGFKHHEEVTQMNMFMAKLNGPSIALTLWGIVPLTKELILAVVGVYITYFVLVAQSL